jgi:beta-lactamase class A
MKQARIAKKVIVVLCLVVLGVYYVGYRSVHVIAHDHTEHSIAVAQAAKVNKANQLESQLETAWKKTLTANPPDGDVDIAAYDSATGATAQYTNTTSGYTFNTASIIKMSILEDTLWQDQQQGTSGLTSDQLANAVPMIENSDNDAATAMWDAVGGQSAIQTFFQKIGATGSTANVQWGLTQTTALDQLKVVNEIAYPGKLLTVASANQADSLLNNVEADQHWGVSGGVPAGVTVQLKNGWLADAGNTSTDGWNINSIGHVHGDGVNYTIAVLTDNNNTEQDGINTIQALSADAWNAVYASQTRS